VIQLTFCPLPRFEGERKSTTKAKHRRLTAKFSAEMSENCAKVNGHLRSEKAKRFASITGSVFSHNCVQCHFPFRRKGRSKSHRRGSIRKSQSITKQQRKPE
jgi:hypothetical protein